MMQPGSRAWFAFALLSAAFFMEVLDYSIVSIALPVMQRELHVTPAVLQWVLSGYIMVFAGTLMLSGGFADALGRRRFFLAGIALFGAASLAASLAHDANVLIAMRALQGLGAAMSNPSGLAMATTLFPAGPLRNRAVGLWAAVGSGGVVAGMLLGGILVGFLGWRSVLWVNVPVCVLLLALVPFFVPRDAPRAERSRLDAGGAVLLTALLLLLTFTIVRAPEEGVLTAVTMARAAGVVAILAAFVFVERRVASPLVPARIFRYPDFSGGAILALVQASGYSSLSVYASIYWQQIAGLSPLMTGLAFLPCALVMTVVIGPTAATLAQRAGARAVSTAGSLLMIAGAILALWVTRGAPSWWPMLIVMVVACIGCMETFEMSMIAGLAHVEERDEATACGAISTMSQIGMGLGVAVAAALAMGKPAALGVHDAFWSPLIFSALTLVTSFFGIAGLAPRTNTGRKPVRLGKIAFVHSGDATSANP
ncbi:MAG: MFS transporter [Candidatus Eremiobacteraeota bacterium]|nr:MFS transporter [Candidatus Eremiobacteraeota bacterium]